MRPRVKPLPPANAVSQTPPGSLSAPLPAPAYANRALPACLARPFLDHDGKLRHALLPLQVHPAGRDGAGLLALGYLDIVRGRGRRSLLTARLRIPIIIHLHVSHRHWEFSGFDGGPVFVTTTFIGGAGRTIPSWLAVMHWFAGATGATDTVSADDLGGGDAAPPEFCSSLAM